MSEPSFSNGFASPWYGGRIKYPTLWTGCVGSWSPLLGPTGATLFDQSGFANHGTLTNMDLATDWVVGQYGHCLDFDGSNDYVNIPNSTHLNNGGIGFANLSLGVWFWRDAAESVSAVDAMLSKDASGLNTGDASIYWDHDGLLDGTLAFYDNGNTTTALRYATSSISLNAWHHVLFTIASGSGSMYLDGSLVDSRSGFSSSIFSNSTALQLGSVLSGDSATSFLGRIAEVTMHSRALTAAEALLLAQRPGIMYELDDSDAWGAVEAGGSVPWWAFANRQSRIIGGGVT